MLTDLDALLLGWLSQCCTCRGVSEAKHRATCAVSAVTSEDLDDLYQRVWDFVDQEVEEGIGRAIEELKGGA